MFLFFSMRLLCSFFRLKELFQVKKWFNDVITLFFFQNAKKLGRSDGAKRRKKNRMALHPKYVHLQWVICILVSPRKLKKTKQKFN